ncbi:MAG: hypothetical protein Q4B43_01990 [Bacteroidota bacterium]|nr:hypothetical protein [Bacteroidota bacterium]
MKIKDIFLLFIYFFLIVRGVMRIMEDRLQSIGVVMIIVGVVGLFVFFKQKKQG